jgi:hypothetical protein
LFPVPAHICETEFIEPAVYTFSAKHLVSPFPANEAHRRILWHFAGALPIHRSQYIDSIDEFTGDWRRPKLKSFEQNRGKPSELGIMLGDKGKGVEVLIPSQLFGFGHTSRERIPRNDCLDRYVRIAPLLTCGDQSSADFRIKSNLVVDRLALLRKSTLVLVLCLREESFRSTGHSDRRISSVTVAAVSIIRATSVP